LQRFATSLLLAAHDVGIGAVEMDAVPSRVGNVGEEAGDEVDAKSVSPCSS
jgi:hypothetical protein